MKGHEINFTAKPFPVKEDVKALDKDQTFRVSETMVRMGRHRMRFFSG